MPCLHPQLHGINRPPHLFRTAPMTRRRHPKKKKGEGGPQEELTQNGYYS